MKPKKRTPKIYKKPLIGAFLLPVFLLACQHAPVGPSNDPETQETLFWQNRKKLVKESEIYKVFEASVKPTKDFFEVFQVLCDQGACSYRPQPGPGKSQKLGRTESDKLFNLLIHLPVNKGETGVAVDYISCRRFKELEGGSWRHHCSVATPVGLLPHTSLPIPELSD